MGISWWFLVQNGNRLSLPLRPQCPFAPIMIVQIRLFGIVMCTRAPAGYRFSTGQRPNSNEISCPTGVTQRFWSSVRYSPTTPPSAFLCFRACSSDQKKTDLRQKSSTMLGAFSLVKSTIGMKNIGLLSGSWRV